MTSTNLEKLRALVADDAYACSFQTFGQYRTAILQEIDAALATAPESGNG